MIKRASSRRKTRIEIDLTGPQGNAFALLGYADQLAKKLGRDSEKIRTEMRSGNYEHLVSTFEKHFGAYVVLYR